MHNYAVNTIRTNPEHPIFLILIKKGISGILLDCDQVEAIPNGTPLCQRTEVLRHKGVQGKTKQTKQMKEMIRFTLAFFIVNASLLPAVIAQAKLSKGELSINGFRNPSIGAEYRYKSVSIHSGYYSTAFEAGKYTNFIRTGLTYWFLPVGRKENPSSFYSSVSYARGLTRDYENKNAAIGEVGFRWMVWKGLNLRLGVAALAAKSESLKISPTPGISYSFFLK
jgi:hypothetical protein